jgi:hypothetical protein
MSEATEWRFCSLCGTARLPEQSFCGNCGNPIADPAVNLDLQPDEEVTTEESVAILMEMTDMETFLHLCSDSPDKALLKISKFLKVNPDTETSSMILVFRFIALAAKAKLAYESNGCSFVPSVFDNCKECLEEFKKARTAAIAESFEQWVPVLEASMEEVAILLEKHVPGKVQEMLGETKMKFLAYGNRLDLHKSVERNLPTSDLREICELTVTAPFTIRSALLGSVSELSGQARAYIMLFEQPDVWGPNDQMNPSRGMLVVTKNNQNGGMWKVEKIA